MDVADLRLVRFDIHGTEPLNTFKRENWELKDKNLPYIIPNGSPFFGEEALTTVYNEAGGILKLGRDYTFEGEFPPLAEVTGRNIVCWIELSDDILQNNASVSISYQSIGAYFVPRNDISNWAVAITKGKIPIPWSKVFDVPPTLPPEYHLHSTPTELSDWYEFTYFFVLLNNGIRSRDIGVNDDITAMIPWVFANIGPPKDAQLARLRAHDTNYNAPHMPTKADIGLGNLDNFDTATVAEDKAGSSSTLFSTPLGLQELVAATAPDMNAMMRSGIMPISQYTGNGYIPTKITGSYEGIGQESEASSICLEKDGTLVVVSNHMDGKSQGLYYTMISNFNKFNAKADYSVFKYQPPSLPIAANRVIMGSGNKVIMVGQKGTNNYYLALTNNSFDQSTHVFSPCNMAAVVAKMTSPYAQFDRAVVMVVGSYVVLSQQYIAADGTSAMWFFRIPLSSLGGGGAVSWEYVPVNYLTFDGVVINGGESLKPASPILVNNRYTRFGPWTFTQPCKTIEAVRRTVLVCEGTDLHVITQYAFTYEENNVAITVMAVLEMWYTFNSAGPTFTIRGKTANDTIDFFADDTAKAKFNAKYAHLLPALNQGLGASTVVVPSGEIVSAICNSMDGMFPVNTQVLKIKGVSTAANAVARLWDAQSIALEVQQTIATNVPSPLICGTFPNSVIYEADGEIFEAVDPDSGKRQGYFRSSDGDFAVRAEATNLTLGSLYAKPTTNLVYRSNLYHEDAVIGITGSTEKLASVLLNNGSASLSSWGYSSGTDVSDYLPANPGFRVPAESNMLISFPRTYQKVLDTPFKKATYTPVTYYGVRQPLLTILKGYIPTDYANTPHWSVDMYVINGENGGLLANLNLAVVALNFFSTATGKMRTKLMLVRPVVEAPNNFHPGVYLITGITVLHEPAHMRSAQGTPKGGRQYPNNRGRIEKPIMSIYIDGNTLKIYMVGGHLMKTTLGDTPLVAVFDVDLRTNTMSNIAMGGKPFKDDIYGDYVSMIPKVGMTDLTMVANDAENTSLSPINPFQYTGGAANILPKASLGRNYMLASNYSETNWILFIQGSVRVMLCGMTYIAPGGTIDLRDIDISPGNKTFYVYLTIEDDLPCYVLSTALLRKANNLLKVATITTGASSITGIVRFTPFMVGKFLLSYTREGGTIPLSSGLPQDPGTFALVRNSELLS